jgi:hypothetical protein
LEELVEALAAFDGCALKTRQSALLTATRLPGSCSWARPPGPMRTGPQALTGVSGALDGWSLDRPDRPVSHHQHSVLAAARQSYADPDEVAARIPSSSAIRPVSPAASAGGDLRPRRCSRRDGSPAPWSLVRSSEPRLGAADSDISDLPSRLPAALPRPEASGLARLVNIASKTGFPGDYQ